MPTVVWGGEVLQWYGEESCLQWYGEEICLQWDGEERCLNLCVLTYMQVLAPYILS